MTSSAKSVKENSLPAFAAGGVSVRPGVESPDDVGAEAHGGEFVAPGAHGSSAKAVIARTHSKVKEIPSRFRFFMFHLLVGVRGNSWSKWSRRSVFQNRELANLYSSRGRGFVAQRVYH